MAAARVQAIPTLVLLHNGKVADVLVGMQPKEKLKERLEQLSPTAAPLATAEASLN